MARTRPRPRPTRVQTLAPVLTDCPACGQPLGADYTNYRTLTTRDGVTRLALRIRRCHNSGCDRHLRPYRPEAEGRLALPHHEFGLDVVALTGALRHAQGRCVPESHRALTRRGVVLAPRTVSNLLDRYDELRALAACDPQRLRSLLQGPGRVVLAIDGLPPDVGHEVLWVVRDCLWAEVLRARSLLSATRDDLARLLREAQQTLPVPVAAVVSDGQQSIRLAVAEVFPGLPHQLCQFHYLREAALPIYEAERHAKKELKKRVRGVRPIERRLEGRGDPEAAVVRGYCAAVRSALTDDGRPPLDAKGLLLGDRLATVAASLDRVAEKGGSPGS